MKSRPSRLIGRVFALGISGIVLISESQGAIAQSRTALLTFVLTRGNATTVRRIPGYTPRFSGVVGNGALIIDEQNQVTGYYFTVSSLEPRTRYAYHFHRAMEGGTPTSCEGDQGLIQGEVAGSIVTDLRAIAPLRPTASGYAFMGSASNPILLPSPVPLAEIGYMNIHPALGGVVGSGIVCANVRLDAGGLVR